MVISASINVSVYTLSDKKLPKIVCSTRDINDDDCKLTKCSVPACKPCLRCSLLVEDAQEKLKTI